MKLGSRVLVVDCRFTGGCYIGPFLCKALQELGFAIRCLVILCPHSAANSFNTTPSQIKAEQALATPPCLPDGCSLTLEMEYQRILGSRRTGEVELQSVVLPPQSSLALHSRRCSTKHRLSAGSLDADTKKLLKNRLLYLCQQISRIFMIFGDELTIGDPHLPQDGYWMLVDLLRDVIQSHKGIINPITLRSASSSLSDRLVPIAILSPFYRSLSTPAQPNGEQPLASFHELGIEQADRLLIVLVQHSCLVISSAFRQQTMLNTTNESLEKSLLDRWLIDGTGIGINQVNLNVNGKGVLNIRSVESNEEMVKRCIMVEDFCQLVLSQIERAISSVTVDRRLVRFDIDGAQTTTNDESNLMMNVAQFQKELNGLVSQLLLPGAARSNSPQHLTTVPETKSDADRCSSLPTAGYWNRGQCRLLQFWRRKIVKKPASTASADASFAMPLQFIVENGSICSSASEQFKGWTKECLTRGFRDIRQCFIESSEAEQLQDSKHFQQQQPKLLKKRRLNRKTIQFPLLPLTKEKQKLFKNEDRETDLKKRKNSFSESDNNTKSQTLLSINRENSTKKIRSPTGSLFIGLCLAAVPALIGSISCLVCVFELILFLELFTEWLGLKRSVKVLSCLTGRICPLLDGVWRRFGVGESWSRLWNSVVRVAVTSHLVFFGLLLVSSTACPIPYGWKSHTRPDRNRKTMDTDYSG